MKSFFIVGLLASAVAQGKAMIVAHGSATTAYTTQTVALFEKDGVGSIKLLRPDGMSAENVVAAVDAGNAELGIIGVEWATVAAVLSERKVTLQQGDNIKTVNIGEDQVLFITYPGGPKDLSKSQLKQILTGSVKNWSEIGGESKDIKLILPKNIGGTTKLIKEALLDGQEIKVRDSKSIGTWDEAAKAVESTPGAIGIATIATKTVSANRPLTPKIAKPINAVYVGQPSGASKRFIDLYGKVLGK